MELKIDLRTLGFGYSFTKCSTILKPRTGVANSCFVIIKGTIKLSFKPLEYKKINVTISKYFLQLLILCQTFPYPKDFLMTLFSWYETVYGAILYVLG